MTEIGWLSTLTALSAPVFVVLLGLEIAWCRRQGLHYHDVRETVGSLSAGVGEQALSGLLILPLLAIYQGVQQASPLSMPIDSAWTWIFTVIAVDFLFYWFHRTCHRSSFTWAFHVVHHQSRDFNLSVALRNSFVGKIVQLVFMLPLAVLGVPAVVFALVKLLTLYHAFWVHTRTVGRVGLLEQVLVTPAHHRVHHARNPRFMNHNYGGMFIVWDKLFGTFQEEDEVSYFHAVPDHPGLDPVRANLTGWLVILRQARAAPTWSGVAHAWFGAPWEPEASTAWHPSSAAPTSPQHLYAYAQLLAVVPGMALVHAELVLGAVFVVACSMLVSLSAAIGLIEGTRWAVDFERARLIVLLGLAVVLAVVHEPILG